MFLMPFLFNKVVLIVISSLVISSATVYGGIKANEYRQTQIIVQEAKQLSSSGKYQEAINKLVESDGKWSFGEVKKEVENLKEENKTLIQASVDYELGKELFDKDKYKDALDVLKKVDSRNINYPSARSLIELAEKKLDTPKGEVAGVKTEVKTSKIVSEDLPTPTTTPTPIIPTPTPEPQPVQHTDSWCKNEAKLTVIKLQDKLNEMLHNDNTMSQQDKQIFIEATKQSVANDAAKLYLQVYNQCLGY